MRFELLADERVMYIKFYDYEKITTYSISSHRHGGVQR